MTKLQDRINKARQDDRQQHQDKEQLKVGVLRAGSTGIMSDEGEFAGACPRVSLLRSKGLEVDPPKDEAFIMFELGYANEDVIAKQLRETLEPGEILLAEEEVPISWTTSNGTLVTGRPDLVICEKKGDQLTPSVGIGERSEAYQPKVGIELKSVHSLWTARDVLFQRKPKLANMAQAAHYMWKLGLSEYKLMYKSYSQLGQGMAGNEWIMKMFPRPGEPDSEYVEYTESEKTGKHTIKHIRQFEIIYDLSFDKNGRVQYKVETDKKWIPTILTKKSIEDYFEFVSKMEQDKVLGPRPIAVDMLGAKQNYTQCKYCPLDSICKSKEAKGYDKWLQEVTDKIAENKMIKLDKKK